jgi:hypothetical protein
MVGGGGKIGGGPPGSRVDAPAPSPIDNAPTKVDTPARKPGDSFERATGAGGEVGPQKLARESSGSTDVLRLARENPAAARQLVATMATQTANVVAQLQQELAGARAVLQELAAQRFTKKAQSDQARELKRHRDKLASLKMRLHLGTRKMALLQQLAGKLGDPRLDEELDRLLKHHEKLKTDWGRRHHLLSIADSFYGADAATPEHLQEVVRADVRTGGRGEAVGSALSEVSPRRVIAELIARTLDGSAPTEVSELPDVGQHGEHGTALKTWGAVRDIMVASLDVDPLAEDE